ncbi:MAG: D-aminoacyl-tRNA deacylase, partial [Proteobacteria bacterium]|nr:D-aminoacyl-tRNA deacylase [Pseudomonadota bacterium]
IGIEKGDTRQQADRLLDKILAYRIFSDKEGKMNLSLTELNHGYLYIPI